MVSKSLKYCTILINLTHHMSWTPLLCWKLVCITGHWGQCWTCPMCDNAKRPKKLLKTGVFLLVLQILALSQSQTTCVEVSNWSNMSQSQGCVKLIEMVQYSENYTEDLEEVLAIDKAFFMSAICWENAASSVALLSMAATIKLCIMASQSH